MEEYNFNDEPDIEEQIFHNNVREQIVSTIATFFSPFCEHSVFVLFLQFDHFIFIQYTKILFDILQDIFITK